MLGVLDQALDVLRLYPFAVIVLAAGLAGLLLWRAYLANLKRHPAKEMALEVGGIDGRIGLLNSAIKSLDFGYGVLSGEVNYWVTAYDETDRRKGGQVMLTIRSKRGAFDAGTVELTERDLQLIGVRVDENGNWPASLRLRVRPASRWAFAYWWDHNDPGTKLTVRLTSIVLFLQELVLPVLKPEAFGVFVRTVNWVRRLAGL